jgi:hypothetical protein
LLMHVGGIDRPMQPYPDATGETGLACVCVFWDKLGVDPDSMRRRGSWLRSKWEI